MQIVPYLRNAIRNWVERVAIVAVDETGVEPNVSIIELGGAVGDIESPLFLESVRWLRGYTGKDNFVHIHVSLVPQTNGEQQKTKPTKHAIASFLGAGLVPDPVCSLVRSDDPLTDSSEDCLSLNHLPRAPVD